MNSDSEDLLAAILMMADMTHLCEIKVLGSTGYRVKIMKTNVDLWPGPGIDNLLDAIRRHDAELADLLSSTIRPALR
jgi:hypothetical protein